MKRLHLVPGLFVLALALLTVSAGRSEDHDPAAPNLVQPGLGLMIRADLLKRDLEQCFRRAYPVQERAEEGEVSSLVQIAARAHLEPAIDPCRAAVNLVIYGNLLGNSVRSVENVMAFTRERSSFYISVELFLDPRCISLGGVGVSIPIYSQLLGIKTAKPTILEDLIQSLGETRFELGRSRDDQKISQAAEDRLRRQIYQQAREPLQKANKRWKEEFLDRLARFGITANDLAFSSDCDAIWLTARLKGMRLPEPPKTPDRPLVLQVHPEMLNRLVAERIAGKTYKEEDLEKLASDLGKYIEMPRLEKREDKPLQVKMARKDPLTLKVEGDTLIFSISGESYTVGDDTYPGMNVTVRYRIVRKGENLHLVREEDLEVLPPDFKPGMRLGARQQVLRTILRRRFGRLLPRDIDLREITIDPISLGDSNNGGQEGLALTISGSVKIAQIETERGWLTVGISLKLDRKDHHSQ